jgi:hypothetical protein
MGTVVIGLAVIASAVAFLLWEGRPFGEQATADATPAAPGERRNPHAVRPASREPTALGRGNDSRLALAAIRGDAAPALCEPLSRRQQNRDDVPAVLGGRAAAGTT